MTDRRRAARLLVLAVAGLAVAGTSAATPIPGPTQRIDLTGSLHVTAGAPVAIQPIDVDLEVGESTSLTFVATLGSLPTDGSVIATIESTDPSASRAATGATPGPGDRSVIAGGSFAVTCRAHPCSTAYSLVVTWIGAPAGGTADIAWTLAATAQFPSSYTGPPSPGRIAVTASAAEARSPESVALNSATGGKAVHLTEADRFRAWTVVFHQAAEDALPPTGQSISQARIGVAVTQTSGTGFGTGSVKDRREANRKDPPVQLRVIPPGGQATTRWASDEPLTFDPLATCPRAGTCETEMTIELAWADGRPDTAFDATWSIDLAAIGPTSRVKPIGASVTGVQAVELARATTSGSFESSGKTARGQSVFAVTGSPAVDEGSPWSRIGLPARAIVTARVTSIGPTALPADAVIQLNVSGQQYSAGPDFSTTVDVHPGEDVSFAFEPRLSCSPGRPNSCVIRGSIGSSIASPGPNTAPAGLQVRVDWSMEVGLAASRTGQVVITVDPSPSVGP